MKILSILLSLNILLASTGFALTEHICTMMENVVSSSIQIESTENTKINDCCSSTTNCSDVEDDACCSENLVGFFKQSLEGNTASEISIKEVVQYFPQIIPLYSSTNLIVLEQQSFLAFHEDQINQLFSLLSAEDLQVFRC